jgi:D-alanyl-lipoteichoic acid acyltransferase DltB (MBOAT superfamily)
MVIADRLALFVEPVYASPENFPGPLLALATLAFAFQIYCDFSGYSDIAIGSARLLGVRLMTNFDRPYFALSIRDFWQRWHISLSTWFRDYVYIPLGGRQKSMPRWCANLLIVFVLSGLWHGANWTFLAWGLLHGLVYVAWVITPNLRASIESALGLGRVPRARLFIHWLVTFLVVNVAWIFFRASNIQDALYILTHLGEGWATVLHAEGLTTISRHVNISPMKLAMAGGGVVLLTAVELLQRNRPISDFFDSLPAWVLWGAYVGLPLAILNFGVTEELPFVYFQF